MNLPIAIRGFFICTLTISAIADEPLGDRAPNKLGVVPELQPINQPQVAWKFQSVLESNGLSDPAASHGMVFVGDEKGALFALTANHGGRLWTFESRGRIHNQPMSDGVRVCFGNSLGAFAVGFGTGRQLWFQPLKRPGRTLIADDTVYVADGDGLMHAYDADSGEQKWATNYANDVLDDPPGFDRKRGGFEDSVARPSGISSDGEFVYQSVFDHCRIVSFNCKTGERGPNFQTDGWILADAAIDDKFLFVGSQDDFTYCFDKKTAKVVWKTKMKSRIESCPAVTETRVVVPSCGGTVQCLNKKTGEPVWQYSFDVKNRAIYSSPIVANGMVYLAAGDGFVFGLSLETGKLEWQLRPSPDSDMYSCLATDGTRLFVQCRTDDGRGENAIFAIGPSE